MKTSVVISAFNGEKYIIEQLQSILDQTVAVDEVLIYDDKSSDSTYELASSFINNNGLSGWRIEKHTTNQGFFKNFINGLYAVKGDIIFFADQDDIWCPNKVERTLELFHSNSDMLSLTSTFSRFNDSGEIEAHVVHPGRKKNGLKKIGLKEFCNFNSYLGMATAIRRELVEKVDFREATTFLTHDKYVNFAAAILDGLYHIDEVLVDRRSYSASESNSHRDKLIRRYNNTQLVDVIYSLECISPGAELLRCSDPDSNKANIVNRFVTYNNCRLSYLTSGNFTKWFRAIKYVDITSLYSWKQYIKDGYSILKFSKES